MTKKSIVLFATLALAACSKDGSDKLSTTTTTGAVMTDRPTTVEEVRTVMLTERPNATAQINALDITNVDGVVTLRGQVADEESRRALVERVRRIPNVREVKDELDVTPTRLEDQEPSRDPLFPEQPYEPGKQGPMP